VECRCSETSVIDPIRVAFLRRLQTFDYLNWSGKPIDPPQCARYGWKVVEKDVLKCISCRNYLSVELPPPSQKENYTEACTKLKSYLVSKHSKFCIFVTNPISDQVCEITHLTKAELLSSIVENSGALDQLTVNFTFPEMKEVEEVFKVLVEKSKLSLSDKTGLILTLTGWTFDKESQLVKCSYCNRKWSLEKYVSKDSTDGLKKTNEEESSINPICQHQNWCAWRHSSNGWQVQLQQLQQMQDFYNSPKKSRLSSSDYASLSDGMRNIRKMLNGTL